MAKVTRFDVNGKQLTEKELNVLKAVQGYGDFAAATEITVGDYGVPSVRSTMARLSKTHGLLNEKVALVGDKAIKTYSAVEGIEFPEADAE